MVAEAIGAEMASAPRVPDDGGCCTTKGRGATLFTAISFAHIWLTLCHAFAGPHS